MIAKHAHRLRISRIPFNEQNFHFQVQQDQNVSNPGCDDAQSYCGLRGGRYPDRKAMGFPFDRNPRTGVTTLNQFLTSNMIVQTTTIRFSNRVVPATTNTARPTTGTGTSSGNTSAGGRPGGGTGTGSQSNTGSRPPNRGQPSNTGRPGSGRCE